jgi:CcmD family protein
MRVTRMENLGYLVAAYSVIWLAISIYVFILYRRQRQLRQEIDSLKEKVRKKGADGGR